MRAVITFHAIDDGPGPLSFPPCALRMLLGELAAAAIPVLPLNKLLDPATVAGVALTFDDGLESVHDTALPILLDHGATAHIFVITGSVGADNRWEGQPSSAPTYRVMNWDRLEAVAARGLRIEAHTHTHPDLRALGASSIAAEMARADETIAGRLGCTPEYFAYPYGFFDDAVRAVARARYRASLTTRLGFVPAQPDLSAVPRLDSHYLRSRTLVSRLGSPEARAYIGLRNMLRRLRGRS